MKVDVKIIDDVIVLKPNERLIGIASGELGEVIKAQLEAAAAPLAFLFDFADVPRIDSSGLGGVDRSVCIGDTSGRTDWSYKRELGYLQSVCNSAVGYVREWYDHETEAIAALRA